MKVSLASAPARWTDGKTGLPHGFRQGFGRRSSVIARHSAHGARAGTKRDAL